MKYQKKVILSIVAHLSWLYIVAFSYYYNQLENNIVSNILLNPYMLLLLYPIIVNTVVVFIYKINPLEDKCNKIWFIVITVMFTIFCWLYVYATYRFHNM